MWVLMFVLMPLTISDVYETHPPIARWQCRRGLVASQQRHGRAFEPAIQLAHAARSLRGKGWSEGRPYWLDPRAFRQAAIEPRLSWPGPGPGHPAFSIFGYRPVSPQRSGVPLRQERGRRGRGPLPDRAWGGEEHVLATDADGALAAGGRRCRSR